MIRLSHLHKYFNKGKSNEIHVINDISLELPDSGMVALFGKSGCGKTTLLNVIGGLDSFHSGELTVEGGDIHSHTDAIRGRSIGYIFQNYNLLTTLTCFENVAAALRLSGVEDDAEIDERVTASLAAVGMEKHKNRTPDTLSGGQQQRIAIARAIVKNPPIILADEPTGNLDENNTVMIMDLLKEISRSCLVLLVTHEAQLVDHYCDTVIELSDGRIISTKKNENANGYTARDKNDIYLGEYEMSRHELPGVCLSYFGAPSKEPISLRMVNRDGRLYLQVLSPQVSVLDETSEVRLREGVFSEGKKPLQEAGDTDTIERLFSSRPKESGRCGRLFTFLSSIKSGYRANFSSKRRGRKLLRSCLTLFSIVLVMMTAVFGTSIGRLIDARRANNPNVFYVYTQKEDTSARLLAAAEDPKSGIDYLRLVSGFPNGDLSFYFTTGYFETYTAAFYAEDFRTHGVLLGASLIKGARVIAGKGEPGEGEAIITRAMADALLEASTLGYIEEYGDLLGLTLANVEVSNTRPILAGIVEGDEPSIYLSDRSLAEYILASALSSFRISDGEVFGTPGESEVVLAAQSYALKNDELAALTPGDEILLHGKRFTISRIVTPITGYHNWLSANSIPLSHPDDICRKRVHDENPGLSEGDTRFSELFALAVDEMGADYFHALDTYYSELDRYLREQFWFEPQSVLHFLAVRHPELAPDAKYLAAGDDHLYFLWQYREANNGKTPTFAEFVAATPSFTEPYTQIQKYENAYLDLFYQEIESLYNTEGFLDRSYAYYFNEADFISLSKQNGATHISADDSFFNKYNAEPNSPNVNSPAVASLPYTVIHSNDPEKTEAYLRAHFSDITTDEFLYAEPIITPNDLYRQELEKGFDSIVAGLVTMGILLGVMCICMYFIMRSSLMGCIKEVGILRAIGVSRRNLIFRFLVEAALLATLTVLVGYLAATAFLRVMLAAPYFGVAIFFYPAWLALAVLAVLYGVTLFSGTLPVLLLLRKTPSEILAKYDI